MTLEQRSVLLGLIMAGVAFAVGGVSVAFSYRASVAEQARHLQALAKTQARFLELIAEFEFGSHPPTPLIPGASLSLAEAREVYRHLRHTRPLDPYTEVMLVKPEGDQVVVLAGCQPHDDTGPAQALSRVAEQALLLGLLRDGRSGVAIGADCKGVPIIAAYEPLAGLGLGLLVAHDLTQLGAPFWEMLSLGIFLGLIVIGLGLWLFFRLTEPLLRHLQQHDQRYYALFEHMHSGVVVYRPEHDGEDFILQDVNQAAQKIAGLDVAAMRGRRVTEVMPELRQQPLFSTMRRVWRSGTPEQCALSLYQDGALRLWADNQVYKLPGGELVAVFHDTTEIHRTQQALRDNEARYRRLVENIDDIVYQFSRQRGALYWSPQVESILGYAPETLRSDLFVWFDAIHPDDRLRVQHAIGACEAGQRLALEYRVRDAEGNWHWFYDRAIARLEQNGEFILEGVASDVSSYKRVEETLSIYHYALNSSLNGIALADLETRLCYVNPAFLRLWGYTEAEQVLGRYAAEFWEQPQSAWEIAEYLRQGEAKVGELRAKRHDGTGFDAEFYACLVRSAEGVPVRMMAAFVDVSARKQTQQALEDSRRRYRTLTEVAPVGIFHTNAAGQCIYVSQNCCRASGLSEAESLGDGWLSALHPEDRERVFLAWQEMVRIGHPFQLEYRLLRPDGKVVWVLGQVAAEFADGQLLGYVGSLTDINELKLSQQALHRERDRFDRLAKISPVGITQVDRDGCLTYANDHAEALLGLSRSEITTLRYDAPAWRISDDAGNPIPAEDLPFSHVKRHLTPLHDARHAIVWPDGRRVLLSINVAPLLDQHGEFDGVVAVLQDITARLEAEQALVASEQRYRALFDQMLDGFALHEMLFDPQGRPQDYRFLSVNPAFEQLTGLRAEAILGRTVREVLPATEDHWITTYGEVARSGDSIRFMNYAEALNKYFEVLAFSPQPGQFATIFQDVTQRVQAEQALRQAHDDLEQRVERRTCELEGANLKLRHLARMKDEFLASVSHELRSPLNAILGGTEIMQEQVYGPLTARQAKILSRVEESGRHLLSLINDILDVAKVEAGKIQLEIEDVSSRSICQSCINLIKEQALKKHIHLEFHCDANAFMVQADARRLKQIIINLLSNAVKFTPEGGRVSLEQEADPELRQACFRVRDTGIGIPAEMSENLFQPFVQLDSRLSRQYEGTGLGLALVKSLTDLHGGSVRLESREGEGSCFTVTLPWRPEAASLDAAVVNPAPCGSPAAEATSHATVLVVEDSPLNRDILTDYLSVKGYRVITADDGNSGLELARRHRPEIILMDIQMPGMDGMEATRHLRADPELAQIPVIALTALVMPGDRERCLQAGANAYLSKPVVMLQLVETIEGLLGSA